MDWPLIKNHKTEVLITNNFSFMEVGRNRINYILWSFLGITHLNVVIWSAQNTTGFNRLIHSVFVVKLLYRYCAGCYQPLSAAAFVWPRYYCRLQWPVHGWYGPSYLCCGWRCFQSHVKVRKWWGLQLLYFSWFGNTPHPPPF